MKKKIQPRAPAGMRRLKIGEAVLAGDRERKPGERATTYYLTNGLVITKDSPPTYRKKQPKETK